MFTKCQVIDGGLIGLSLYESKLIKHFTDDITTYV